MDQYTINKKPVGKGDFGKVFKAIRKKDNKIFAIKVINKNSRNKNIKHQITRTIKIERAMMNLFKKQKLDHKNILVYRDIFENKSKIFIVMDFVKGKSIGTWTHENKISPEDYLYVFKQILEGIKYLHNHGIVHRDIKDDNIIIMDDLTVKIIDYGLSCILENDVGCKTKIGCIFYNSIPFQLQKVEKPYRDHMLIDSDIWALGIVFYETIKDKVINFPEKKTESWIDYIKYNKYKPLVSGNKTIDKLVNTLLKIPKIDYKKLNNRKYLEERQNIDYFIKRRRYDYF